MAPTLLKLLTSLPSSVRQKYNTSSLKNIVVAAAPCPMQVKEAVLEQFGPVLYEFYGSTELSVNTVLKPQDQLRKPGSCGQASGDTEIHIVDLKTGRDVEIGKEGVLYVKRSTGVIDGYLNAPEKTQEMILKRTVIVNGKEEVEELATVGDIARQDEEGFFYICDRHIDMIISAGVNIYPAEIEDALHHHPAIQDCAVFGVPDDHWGERVHAAIVLKSGFKVSAEELKKFCKEYLANYKIPREFTFHEVQDFPRDAAGKILKRKLREPYWKGRKSRL